MLFLLCLMQNFSSPQWSWTWLSQQRNIFFLTQQGNAALDQTHIFLQREQKRWSDVKYAEVNSQESLSFCYNVVISVVSPGSLTGWEWGQWILTSFTHGCKQSSLHNAGLPALLSNVSSWADRSLPGWKMDELSSWPLACLRSQLNGFFPLWTKTPYQQPPCSQLQQH